MTVLYYKMTLTSYLTGQNIGCFSLMFQNVRYCTFGNTPYTGNYHLNGIQLELLDDFRDLGIQIDSKLKFQT